MLRRSLLVLVAVGCASLALSAGEVRTVKLFEPVAIAGSTGTFDGYTTAEQFAERQFYLACEVGDTAIVSGPNVGAFIADNYIQVQADDETPLNFCPGIEGTGCFSGTIADPMALLGEPAESAYLPVASQDVSAALQEGVHLYTFRLMDWGYTYASSEIWLTTTCKIKDQVCHFDSGKKTSKTLTLGASAIPAHLRHGDTLGACPAQ
jgi:hypothetical protein